MSSKLLLVASLSGFILVSGEIHGYPWPVRPFDSQHYVRSVPNECRGDRDHFHNGIDIGGSGTDVQTDTAVFAVNPGTTYLIEGTYPGVYVYDSYCHKYIHLKDRVAGGIYVYQGDSLGRVDNENHLHFTEGPNKSEINPLRSGGISPFADNADPVIDEIYLLKNGTNTVVDPNNVSGKVDIVVKAHDTITGYVPLDFTCSPVLAKDCLEMRGYLKKLTRGKF